MSSLVLCPAMTIENKPYKYFIGDECVSRLINKANYAQTCEHSLFGPDDQNLFQNSALADLVGFEVVRCMNSEEFDDFSSSVLCYVSNFFGFEFDSADSLNDSLCTMSDAEFHENIVRLYKGIPFKSLPFGRSYFERICSNCANSALSFETFSGSVEGPMVRIVRPFKSDFNPPHRDIYINRLKSKLNVYLPIFGSSELSSLPLVEGSHKWFDSETQRTENGPTIDGLPFSVPAILSMGDSTPLRMKRPIVANGELMLFSPYLIHGGAMNLSKNIRISLEMRFSLKNT